MRRLTQSLLSINNKYCTVHALISFPNQGEALQTSTTSARIINSLSPPTPMYADAGDDESTARTFSVPQTTTGPRLTNNTTAAASPPLSKFSLKDIDAVAPAKDWPQGMTVANNVRLPQTTSVLSAFVITIPSLVLVLGVEDKQRPTPAPPD